MERGETSGHRLVLDQECFERPARRTVDEVLERVFVEHPAEDVDVIGLDRPAGVGSVEVPVVLGDPPRR